MNVVLIGFMCSGKSRVGQALAKKLGWTHMDTDAMIEKNVGAPIAEIIRKRGEPAFRDIERKAVELVSMSDKTVISTGGGVPMNPANMKSLSLNGTLVWIKVSPETVMARAGNLASRPLIDPRNPLESIKQRMAEREIFYGQSSYHVSSDHQSPAQVADEIYNLLPVNVR